MNFTAQGYQDPGALGSFMQTVAYFPLANAETWTDIIPLQTAQVQTATGTGTASFTPNVGQVNDLTAVLPSTLPQTGLPSGLTFPDGLFSYTIGGTPPFTYLNWGLVDTLSITLPSTVPANAQYWMYTTGQGWVQVPIQSINGNTVTLKLTDGGVGDSSRIGDSQIVNLGGIAVSTPKTATHLSWTQHRDKQEPQSPSQETTLPQEQLSTFTSTHKNSPQPPQLPTAHSQTPKSLFPREQQAATTTCQSLTAPKVPKHPSQ